MAQPIGAHAGAPQRATPLQASTHSGASSSVDHSRGYPRGDGTFANRVKGTQPQPELDLHLSMMANDVYASDAPDLTCTRSEADLAAAGWHRLRPDPESGQLVDREGHRIPIKSELLNPSRTGFDAAIYQNDRGQYVVAFRGTDDKWRRFDDNGQFLGPGTDARANLGQGMGLSVEQYQQAMKLAKVAVDTFGPGNVAFTGHSLGGGLASAAMLKTGVPGVTFNAAGLSDNTLRELGFASPNQARDTLAHSGQIRRYNVAGEPLTAAQQLPGVGALPEALGHELRVAAPPGVTGLGALHGGGGSHQAYVESLRLGMPIQRPPSPPPTLNHIEDTIESGLKGAISIGVNGYQAYQGVSGALGQTWDEAGAIARTELAQGKPIQASVKLTGSAADGVLDAGASIVKEGTDAVGDLLMEGTTLAGNALRNETRGSVLGSPAQTLATGVETLGYYTNQLVDGAGAWVATGMDKLGDGAQWTSDRAADGVQWATDRLAELGNWLNSRLNPFSR
ncbi:MAG: hypothetical protein Q4F13_05255 [Pseudomonadota bacterium]|nr:hypothetical protein [Pseudomonadota bacterium]